MGIFDFLKKKDDQSSAEPPPSSDDISKELAAFLEPDKSKKTTPIDPPPPSVQATTTTPSGLYPYEVLMLDFATSLYIDQEEFPAFWQQLGVENMPLTLSSLVDRGFLEAASIQKMLESHSVPKLKDAMRKKSLPLAGNKAELIDRLLTSLSHEELMDLFPRQTFALTSDGIRALHEAIYVPYIHRRPVAGLTIFSMHDLVANNPDISYRDLVFAHMEEESARLFDAQSFEAYRMMRYRMYQFHMEENKLKRSFPLLIETMYCDLSGVLNGFDPLHRFISEKYFFPYDTSIVRLPTGLIQAAGRLKESLGLSEEMMRALLIQFFGQFRQLPFYLFTPEEAAVIVLLELRGDTERLRQVYEIAHARFYS